MTDEELMCAYADGDMKAFETLYQRHKNRIFGFLLSRLKNRTEAEEVFQAVFAKLHAARGRYRRDVPFLPWVFTIARNALIDHIRKNDAYRKHIASAPFTVENHADQTSDRSGGIALEELSNLTEAQRQALQFRFERGLSFTEIAEQMQTSAANSRQIVSRAVRKLRKLMAGKESNHEKA